MGPRVGVAEAEVGPAVQDDDLGWELCNERGGRPVRQREEDQVVAGECLWRGRGDDPVGQRREVAVDVTEALARRGVGREGTDLDLRMGEQEPEDLPAGIPAGADDGCGGHDA